MKIKVKVLQEFSTKESSSFKLLTIGAKKEWILQLSYFF